MNRKGEGSPAPEEAKKFAEVVGVNPVGRPIQAQTAYERFMLQWLTRRGVDPRPPENGGEGRWPSTRQQFLWDLAPNNVAANRDGIIPPDWKFPEWAENASDSEVENLLPVTAAARQEAEETTRNVELKASRLATSLVVMLAATVALIAFEISKIGPNPPWWRGALAAVGILTGGAAAWSLVVGMSRAVDADTRMGLAYRASPKRHSRGVRAAFYAELYGYHLAEHSRSKKVVRLLNARSAASRSLLFLTLSAVFGLGLAVVSSLTEQPPQVVYVPSPMKSSTPSRTPLPTALPLTPGPKPSGAVTGKPTRRPAADSTQAPAAGD